MPNPDLHRGRSRHRSAVRRVSISKAICYPVSFLERSRRRTRLQRAHQGHAFVWKWGSTTSIRGQARRAATRAARHDDRLRQGAVQAEPAVYRAQRQLDQGQPRHRDAQRQRRLRRRLCRLRRIAASPGSSRPTLRARSISRSTTPSSTAADRSRRNDLTGTMASTGSQFGDGDRRDRFSASRSNDVYALVNGTEIIKITSIAGNTINYGSRRPARHDGRARAAAETIRRLASVPDRPQWRPLHDEWSRRCDPRRIQGFTRGMTNGQVRSPATSPERRQPDNRRNHHEQRLLPSPTSSSIRAE